MKVTLIRSILEVAEIHADSVEQARMLLDEVRPKSDAMVERPTPPLRSLRVIASSWTPQA